MESREPHWLSTDEQHAWRTYLRVTAQVEEALNRDLIDSFGHSLPEYEILARLSEAENGFLRMSDLADLLVFSRSRLTHTVRRLEEQGVVERTTNPVDRRGVDCRLTDAGFELVNEMAPVHVASVREHLVDKLGHDQMIELGDLLFQLVDDPKDIR